MGVLLNLTSRLEPFIHYLRSQLSLDVFWCAILFWRSSFGKVIRYLLFLWWVVPWKLLNWAIREQLLVLFIVVWNKWSYFERLRVIWVYVCNRPGNTFQISNGVHVHVLSDDTFCCCPCYLFNRSRLLSRLNGLLNLRFFDVLGILLLRLWLLVADCSGIWNACVLSRSYNGLVLIPWVISLLCHHVDWVGSLTALTLLRARSVSVTFCCLYYYSIRAFLLLLGYSRLK